MKLKFNHKFMFFLTICFFVIKVYGDESTLPERIDAAQVKGSVIKLSTLADEGETLWPSNTILYFQSENKIGEAFEMLAKTNFAAIQALENQSENVLGKHCQEGARAENNCFKSKIQIAERFARVSTSAPDIRGAEILAKFLGEVRTTIITNYQFTRMQMNVMPPVAPKGQMVFTGMDPNVISDTNARAAYQKAIDENSQRDDENDLQLHTLPKINKTITLHFFNYIKVLFAKNPEAKNLVNLSALARLTKDEQQQLQ